MFRENINHIQRNIFDIFNLLSKKKRRLLEGSSGYYFYKTISYSINEEAFSCLYCEDNGRPNAPINSMVSSLILMNKHRWTYNQLFEEIHFNLLTRASSGLFNLEETPFDEATIFNFQNRVSKYFAVTGINLLVRQTRFSGLRLGVGG